MNRFLSFPPRPHLADNITHHVLILVLLLLLGSQQGNHSLPNEILDPIVEVDPTLVLILALLPVVVNILDHTLPHRRILDLGLGPPRMKISTMTMVVT